MERILIAYDGSESSRCALERAAELARALRGSVDLLVVGALLESGYGTVVPVMEEELYRAVVAEGVRLLGEAGIEARGHLVWGDAGPQITAAAEEQESGLLVVGHRGKGGLRSLLLGSVAKYVIDHAPCSVLVVREG